jgi:hypothetical protein
MTMIAASAVEVRRFRTEPLAAIRGRTNLYRRAQERTECRRISMNFEVRSVQYQGRPLRS